MSSSSEGVSGLKLVVGVDISQKGRNGKESGNYHNLEVLPLWLLTSHSQ